MPVRIVQSKQNARLKELRERSERAGPRFWSAALLVSKDRI